MFRPIAPRVRKMIVWFAILEGTMRHELQLQSKLGVYVEIRTIKFRAVLGIFSPLKYI
jgi:hypothetical protein